MIDCGGVDELQPQDSTSVCLIAAYYAVIHYVQKKIMLNIAKM